MFKTTTRFAALVLALSTMPSVSSAAPTRARVQNRTAAKAQTRIARQRARTTRPRTKVRVADEVRPMQRATGAGQNSIEIRGRVSDPGMKATIGANNTIVLSGTTHGPTDGRGILGERMRGVYAKSVSFSLDIDKAPTTDAFGRQTFREKNSRLFQVTTSPGWTANEVAHRLADKVNQHRSYRADVHENPDGTATLAFRQR